MDHLLPVAGADPTGDDLLSRDGFTRWVEPHWSTMSLLAERLTNGVDHEDVLQDALALAWRTRRKFDPARGSARNWLLALTADQARKTWRRSRREPRYMHARVPNEPHVHLDIQRALGALSPRQRMAVDLYYYLGLSVADAAAVMRCAEGTVKSTLADARRRLRDVLGDDYL